MNVQTIAWAAAAIAAVGLAGCGSDSANDDSTAAENTSSSQAPASSSSVAPPLTSAPPTSAPSAAPGALTLSDYLKTAGITETPVRAGDPGAPKIELPIPALWQQAIDVPGKPFWAIIMSEPADPANPPLIEARLSKLSAEVPIQTVFDHAGGELENLPGYQSLGDGGRAELGGVEAYQMGGLFEENGVTKLVAQKTLLIASPTGPFLLRVRATGPEADTPALISATAELDDNTVITP